MSHKTINNIKLGAFVFSGLILLILLLYLIGKNKNLFGSKLIVKARFENVQGLKSGNNVRYGGIDIGTVDKIVIINDSTLEVYMRLENKMKKIIKKNAIVAIGTDGLVGNKIVNILTAKGDADNVDNNDLLTSKKAIDTDEMLRTLHKTNNDIAIITENLKATVIKINKSTALWKLINDEKMVEDVHFSINNFKNATVSGKRSMYDLEKMIQSVKNGNGTIGLLLKDTSMPNEIRNSIEHIHKSTQSIQTASKNIDKITDSLNSYLSNQKGTLQLLLKDSTVSENIEHTIINLEKGTDGFNKTMEAIKHSFLFRGYFKRHQSQ